MYALLRELHELRALSEPSVSQAKLAWWRQDLAAMANDQASHPVSQALKLHGFGAAAPLTCVLSITAATETDLTQRRFLDEASLARYLVDVGGAPLKALALAQGLQRAQALDAIEQLGAGIARARLLMEVGRDARQQRIYIPHATLKHFAVPAADLLAAKATTAIAAMAAHIAHTARQQITTHLALLDGAEKRTLRCAAVMAALTLARLDQVAADGYQIAVHRISLTPLRKLLLAWRQARRI